MRRIAHWLFDIAAALLLVSALAAACADDSESHQSALYVVDVDGSGITELWFASGQFMTFAWSSDGRSVAASSWPDGPSLFSVDTGKQTPLVGSGNVLGWTPDGRLVAVQDDGTVAFAPPDGSDAAFRAQGSQVSFTDSGDIAFIYDWLGGGGPGLVVAAVTPDGWSEVASYPEATLIAIDERTGRYAFESGTTRETVSVGEIVFGEGRLPTENIASFDIADTLPETRIGGLALSPGAGKLALLRWEAGEARCSYGFEYREGRLCRSDVLNLQLVVIDIVSGGITQAASPQRLLTEWPTLRWRDSETLMWAPSFPTIPLPSSEGLGIDVVQGYNPDAPVPDKASPDGGLLAVPIFESGVLGIQIWPRDARETRRYDSALGWWVMRLSSEPTTWLEMAWSPDGTRLAVVVSGDAELAVLPTHTVAP